MNKFLVKPCLLILVLLMQTSCAHEGKVYGVGQSVNNHAQGEWTIYNKKDNRVLGKGVFINGKPDGLWTLWDDGGLKAAEIHYANGIMDGKYNLYYSHQFPEAQNRLATTGYLKNGKLNGLIEAFNYDGQPTVKFNAVDGEIAQVTYGQLTSAEIQIKAEKDFLKICHWRIMGGEL